jgi:hypothetical protein
MFILEVTVVLYFIKILSGSRNFYRLRMTSFTSTNVFTISCLSIEPPPPPTAPVNLVLQHWCKALQNLYCTIRRLFVLFVAYSRTIRTIRRLFADYSYYSSTIRGLFVLFVDYSRTIRTIRRLFVLVVDYSHHSLHYSSFINCQIVLTIVHKMYFRFPEVPS